MWFASGEFRYWFQTALFVMLALAAWRCGGGPERVLAGVLLWFSAANPVIHGLFGRWNDLSNVNTGSAAIDAIALVVSLAVALFANRMYPLVFAAFQLLATTAHLAKDIARGTAALAYVVLYVGPSYFQIIILAIGIWTHHLRVRRYGTYRDWRISSNPSRALKPPS